MRRSTIRKAVLALCVLSYGLFCVSPKFAFSPSFIVLSLLWYRHLPSRRRTVRSFCRYWSLVAAPLLWAVFLGGWLDNVAAGTLGPPPIPFVFLLPWAIPVIHVVNPEAAPLLYHAILDAPLMLVVAFYKFCTSERLNSLATVIHPNVVLGSLPFHSDVAELEQLGVTHIVNMCREWRGPKAEYEAKGMVQLRLPTTDGMPPTAHSLAKGVEFVEAALDANPSARIFIHCRFGMGRSATMALVALAALGVDPDAAIAHMKRLRPEVTVTVRRLPSVISILKELETGS